MSMRRRGLCQIVQVSLFVGLVVGAGEARPAPQRQNTHQERPSYSEEVHLATVAVTVTDRNRAPVADLTVDDFEVIENGKPQDAAFLLGPGKTPLEVAVLLDTSSSIGRSVPDVRPLLATFLRSLNADDCVLMLPFSDTVGPGSWGVDAERFTLGFALGGVTRLHDAIIVGLRALGGKADELAPLLGDAHCGGKAATVSSKRRVAVLITDGDDTASAASFGEALVTAWTIHVPVIIMAVGNADELTELANVSGGRLIKAADRRQQAQSLRDILATLRSVYVIGYYLTDLPTGTIPEKRALEVRVRRDNAEVASPDAIYVSTSSPGEAAVLTGEGRAFFEAGDIARALESFERATARYWEVPSAHYLRAVVAHRLGHLELARSAARWAVFLDPADPAPRHLLERITTRKESTGGIPATSTERRVSDRPPENGSQLSVWVGAAENTSLPFQYAGDHVARLVASYLGDDPAIRIVRRPYDHGIAYGLSVAIGDIDDDGGVRGEVVLWSRQMELLDSRGFELTAPQVQLSARDTPPQAPERLRAAVAPLREQMRGVPGDSSGLPR